MTISDGLKLLGINWHQGQKIMDLAVERGLERRKLEKVRYVGLDEKSFRRGQDYMSVMNGVLNWVGLLAGTRRVGGMGSISSGIRGHGM